MDAVRKKELKQQSKLHRPAMGVFRFYCPASGRSYIACANDIPGTINSMRFKLNAGMHPAKNLLGDWRKHREDNFVIETLEELPPDTNDTAREDYTPELEILREIWLEQIENSEMIR